MIQTAITAAKNTFLNPIPATRNVTVRKSVYDLDDAEVLALRRAFAAFQALPNTDYRSYQYVASIHGLNQYYCPHGTPPFAIWHRPYVLMFEQALQTFAPGLGLPYWNWSSARASTEGIPAIFTAKTYIDPQTGTSLANPLYKAAITYTNPSYPETVRNPAPARSLASMADLIRKAKLANGYDRFSPALENPHNKLHGWVGGTMGQSSYAAFDPVFWVHHCYVEKVFCDWQDDTQAAISPTIAGQILNPFNKTADQVWNYKALGYRYAPESDSIMPSPRAKLLAAGAQPSTSAATFDLNRIPGDVQRAHLNFIKTQVPKNSFEVRVFFNQPNPGVDTPTDGNPNYAGSIHTFGHGECTGGPGHCSVPKIPEDATQFAVLRPEHHLTPRRISLDVIKAVQAAKKGGEGHCDIQLLLVDAWGKVYPPGDFEFEMLTLDAV